MRDEHLPDRLLPGAIIEPIVFQCFIPGRIGIKKNGRRLSMRQGRMTNRPSQNYEFWASNASWYIRKAMNGMDPIDYRVNLRALVCLADKKNEPDLSNAIQGAEDLLEELGVLTNDRLISSYDGTRKVFGKPAGLNLIITRCHYQD